MSSLIFGSWCALEHSLKTRLINVGARRASSICYQCNEGPFSWSQCDLMSLQPFPILLLMMNIAHLLLQKENPKEDRAVGIPLLDDILCDNLVWKGSVPTHRQGTSSQYQYCYLDLVIWYWDECGSPSGRGCKKSIGQIKSLRGLQFHRKRQISPPSYMNIASLLQFFTQVSNNSLK